MIIPPARRTRSVKEYYFSRKNRELARLNAERAARGERPVINLGIGSPDGSAPQSAIGTLTAQAVRPDVHAYQSYTGLPELRKAFAQWYDRWYGVTLDPDTEIQPLVGSKEGILLLSLAWLDPGDKVLIPDPGYPTYTSATLLCEAVPVPYDLTAGNGWFPDLDALEENGLDGVKIMWVNYPHMPTGAKATPELYERLAAFGRKHGILIVNDNPYSFILNDKPLSLLAAPGAKDCCMELNSLSKAHNMAGWRIGMAAGAPDAVAQLLKVKSQMDSGMFKPLQLAAASALSEGPEWFAALNAEYRRRKDYVQRIFDEIGASYDPESAGLFVWGRVDDEGEAVSDRILYGCGVFITPGFVFGKNGVNYIRASLCAPVPVLEEALERIKTWKKQ